MDQLFADLGLAPDLMRAVEDSGYTEPTPVQMQAIPVILEGRDVLAGAQTGTGKTAGFALPLLQRLMETEPANPAEPGTTNAVRALIVTPTRELAAQVEASVRTYGKYLSLKSAVVYGGVSIGPQIDELKGGVDVLVATPGRLLDHAAEGTVDLSYVEIFVLDEADRMLDMGFINDVKRIIALLPLERQSLLFSATFTDGIRELASGFLRDPVQVEVARRNAESELVTQRVHPVPHERKRALLTHLIKSGNWQQVLVFTRTKHGANRLAHQLGRGRISATAIHGNKGQGARIKALDDFKAGQIRVLVATDLAARGLDIVELPHVVNFDMPHVAEDYVHRIGRTGRAGVEGEAISLVTPEDEPLLAEIEKLLGRKLEQSVVPGFEPGSVPPHLLRQQQNQRVHGERGEHGEQDEGDVEDGATDTVDAEGGVEPAATQVRHARNGGNAGRDARNSRDGQSGRRGRGRNGGQDDAGAQQTVAGDAATVGDAQSIVPEQSAQPAQQQQRNTRNERGQRNGVNNRNERNEHNSSNERGENAGNRQPNNADRRARKTEDHDNRGNRDARPQRRQAVRDDDWGNRVQPTKPGRRPAWLKADGEIDEVLENIGNRLPVQKQKSGAEDEEEINYNIALPGDNSDFDADDELGDESNHQQPATNEGQMFPSSAGFMDDVQGKRRGGGKRRGRSNQGGHANQSVRGALGGQGGQGGQRGQGGQGRDGRQGGQNRQSRQTRQTRQVGQVGQGGQGRQRTGGNQGNAGADGNQQRQHARRGPQQQGQPGQTGQRMQGGQRGAQGQNRNGGSGDNAGSSGGGNADGAGNVNGNGGSGDNGGNGGSAQGRRRRRGRGRGDGSNRQPQPERQGES